MFLNSTSDFGYFFFPRVVNVPVILNKEETLPHLSIIGIERSSEK